MSGPGSIRLVLTDCDGVLTDGTVWVSATGEETARFSRRDGLGVALLRERGVDTGIVTREAGGPVVPRALKLGIEELHLSALDKGSVLQAIAARRGLSLAEIAYLGDDVVDLPALSLAGLAACPSDADPRVQAVCHYVCTCPGGRGAFREVADLILSVPRTSA